MFLIYCGKYLLSDISLQIHGLSLIFSKHCWMGGGSGACSSSWGKPSHRSTFNECLWSNRCMGHVLTFHVPSPSPKPVEQGSPHGPQRSPGKDSKELWTVRPFTYLACRRHRAGLSLWGSLRTQEHQVVPSCDYTLSPPSPKKATKYLIPS
jgi:hypothetical protein